MKIIRYIFIVILLITIWLTMITCKTTNTKQKRYYKSAKPITVDSSYADTDFDGVAEYKDAEPNVDSSKVIVRSYKVTSSGKWSREIENKKITIVDNTITSIDDKQKFIKGLIAYSVPDEMTVGENYSIKIRISKDTTEKKTLIIGETKIHIADTTINSTITIESIRVSSIMSASLTSNGDEYFNITSKSTETQNIEQFGYTEWEWNVMPLKGGDNPLKLIIKVRIISEDGEKSFKDIVVFEKNVTTKTNIGYSVKNLINKYWQWSLSTLIIPFFVWLYNRKKKKKEGE